MADRMSITDAHVKRFPEIRPEADDPDKEQIDRAGHSGCMTDIRPGCFHLPTPVDIVEYEDRLLPCSLPALVEVAHRRLVSVITVEKDQVGGHAVQRLREGLVEISAEGADVLQSE